jgi:hypothetical protein
VNLLESGATECDSHVTESLPDPTSCTGGTVLLSGGFTSFTHIGLTNGTTYFYRVCVADKADNVATGATASATPQGGADPVARVETRTRNDRRVSTWFAPRRPQAPESSELRGLTQ